MEKYVKLIMVTKDNNNKYYEMFHDGKSSTFTVKYGRVESTAQNGTYGVQDWDKKYKEKVKKGYKDVTDLVSVKVDKSNVTQKLVDIKDNTVAAFVTLMKRYTDNLVKKVYSVTATSVTQKQIDEAQSLIDQLTKVTKTNDAKANEILLELYMVIPRYMGKVQHQLLPHIDLKKTIIQEQDNLDAMASQVGMIKKTTKDTKVEKKAGTILDAMGITMSEVTKYPAEIDYLIKQLKNNKIKAVFEVNNPAHSNLFEKWMSTTKNKKTSILIHGTRCTSVLPILEQGLKIRPSGNYQFSGKAYGEGNYFSEVCDKSLGYTGWDDDQVLLVYEVHTGNPFVYNGWFNGNSFSLNYKELSQRGYDCTYVKAGNGMRNSEIIAYREHQCHPKYIIHLKR